MQIYLHNLGKMGDMVAKMPPKCTMKRHNMPKQQTKQAGIRFRTNKRRRTYVMRQSIDGVLSGFEGTIKDSTKEGGKMDVTLGGAGRLVNRRIDIRTRTA